MFQFCAGPYVWCPSPRQKGRTHVGNCTVTPAVCQSRCQSSTQCSFQEVLARTLVGSFQMFLVIHADLLLELGPQHAHGSPHKASVK